MERKTSPHVDRISALPDPILHHILSFVSLKKVAQTSTLSKRWKQVWYTFPSIVFDDYYASFRRQKIFLECLEQTLLNRHMDAITLGKFKLTFRLSEDPTVSSNMHRCLSYAIASYVKDLSLSVDYWHRKYTLPQVVFYAKSVVELDLACCKLESPRSNVTLSSLRKLYLRGVVADDQVIKDLIAGCSLIEYMDFFNCQGLKSLELLNISSLKEFKLVEGDRLERVYINGVNVHSVDIWGQHTQLQIDVTRCKNLRTLKLFGLSITDKWLCNLINELPFLENLEISACMKLRRIKLSSHCLKKVQFERHHKLKELNLDTRNLSVFDYGGNLILFSSNDFALLETKLVIYSCNIDNQWYVKLIKLLAKFDLLSKVLNLECDPEAVIIPRELRESLCHPLTYDKHVCLFVHSGNLNFSLTEVVDGLLWITSHAETLSIKYQYDFYELFFQFSYKKSLIFEEEAPHCCRCCRSRPLSCWQHCIKEVKIERSRNYPRRACIGTHRYSSEDGDIWEKIDDLWISLHETDDRDKSESCDESLMVARSLMITISKFMCGVLGFCYHFHQPNAYSFKGFSFSSLVFICGVLNLLFRTKRDFLHGLMLHRVFSTLVVFDVNLLVFANLFGRFAV